MKNSEKHTGSSQESHSNSGKSDKRKEEERKIDEQVEESFPASDPPSHVDRGSGRGKED